MQFPDNALVHQPTLLEYITSERIRVNAQLDGALKFLGPLGSKPLDVRAFEEAAGVGVTVSRRPLCVGRVSGLVHALIAHTAIGLWRSGLKGPIYLWRRVPASSRGPLPWATQQRPLATPEH